MQSRCSRNKKKKNISYFLIVSHNGFVQDMGVWIIELLMSQRNFSQTTCVRQNDIINKLSAYFVSFQVFNCSKKQKEKA